MSDRARRWDRFVDAVAVAWVVLFAMDVAGRQGWLQLSPRMAEAVGLALPALLAVFLADVAVLYRRSDASPTAFLRSHWLYVLTVVPWFRPLRLLRAGRGLRALRLLARSRRAGSALNKLRRTGSRLWQRLGD